ncbi:MULTISPECIES: NAD(P)-binding domain-containing protein [unclassified Paracoccus (in: a-proteobacteria)]|uniref:NAD(P)-binding domain-containing protein n=1 Tax=unclassified Paracoccus (in: a-proteobacteria) TaxID=2688777 RepID=UPI00160060C3|nr:MULTISPECIES: NAD(P)-binding domain-containing protein [unclassified Paracoccus (in: a-proteobacteria)]MBB1490550.1 NAD(P)/FAD-dependent oxidoreductase [Paracoccus sp. MC1854]MBB1499010.1 NAD(P)/FAD-dependent oxidoreductase [Paracoccus sp. MC1862]QQO44647.1 NAD(P)/FAD-dependent oxidoreductase [Paracoccus sp. MC1862]
MTPKVTIKVDIAVIGAGQAGLSSAYHLARLGLRPWRGFAVLDRNAGSGGAWQHRWPSLTLSTANAIHDLPGMAMSEAVETGDGKVRAAEAVPRYHAAYARRFALPILRPVAVRAVRPHGERLRVDTDRDSFSVRGIINATGTWDTPNMPRYPGAERFRGRQMHSRDYRRPQDFAGRHVVIVGAGISALQHLDEISQVTTTTWVSRRRPQFSERPFTAEDGRAAVARVEEQVRRGLKPGSVVSVTGLPWTSALRAARQRGALEWRPMFSEITETGVRWPDGTEQRADVILWATGFQHTLDHLAPLGLEEDSGGIAMTGRLATQVARDPRIHLVGYGPSASTIGANRAGGAAARELASHLGMA